MQLVENIKKLIKFVRLKSQIMMSGGRKKENVDFEDNWSRYYRRCILFAKSYVFDSHTAESLAAEAMSVYWERKASGEEIEMVLPFLFSVIRNKALQYLRHESVRMRVQGEMSSSIQDELQFRIDSLQSCDPHTLFAGDVQKILNSTLKTLGKKTDRIFSLSRFQGLSNREIASELGITEKAVEYHMTKALKALRVSLKDYLPLVGILLGI